MEIAKVAGRGAQAGVNRLRRRDGRPREIRMLVGGFFEEPFQLGADGPGIADLERLRHFAAPAAPRLTTSSNSWTNWSKVRQSLSSGMTTSFAVNCCFSRP